MKSALFIRIPAETNLTDMSFVIHFEAKILAEAEKQGIRVNPKEAQYFVTDINLVILVPIISE